MRTPGRGTDGRTDGRPAGRTDGRTDIRGDANTPRPQFVVRGIKNGQILMFKR